MPPAKKASDRSRNDDGGLFDALPGGAPDADAGLSGTALEREIDRLRDELRRHDAWYYLDAQPVVDDIAYDAMKRRLKRLEARDSRPIPPDSPTQYVGAPPGASAVSVRAPDAEAADTVVTHSTPMLSIDNVDNDRDLLLFLQRIPTVLKTRSATLAEGGAEAKELVEAARKDAPGFLVEMKIDGLSMALVYRRGALVQAATRGDGHRGEEVTANALLIADIPEALASVKTLPHPPAGGAWPERFEVRGEVYLPLAEFDRLARQDEETGGEALYANPRNLAVGVLRRDPGKDEASEKARLDALKRLRFFAYQIIDPRGVGIGTQLEMLETLERLGFSVNPERRLCPDDAAVLRARDHYLTARHGLPYATDGLVVKVNGLARQAVLGLASTHPNWARAYKFPPERVETTVKDIRIQVGKLGRLTPVAELAPVKVAGTTVSRASLHNATLVMENDIRPGDRVLVEKAGEIIPQVAVNLSKADREAHPEAGALPPFAMPASCPECGAPVRETRNPTSAGRVILAHFCDNTACPAKILARLSHFASRGAMDIDGLGDRQLAALARIGRVKDCADLYTLDRHDLVAMMDAMRRDDSGGADDAVERLGEKWADELYTALHSPMLGGGVAAATPDDLARALETLGAKGFSGKAESAGGKRRLAVAWHFGDAAALRAASREALAAVPVVFQNVNNLIAAIAASKDRGLARLLFALAIPDVGESASAALAGRFGTIDALRKAEAVELAATPMGESSTYRIFGRESAERLYAALEPESVRKALGAAPKPEEGLLFRLESLAIPGFGAKKCRAVAERYRTPEALCAADPAELADTPLEEGNGRRKLGMKSAAALRLALSQPEAAKTLSEAVASPEILAVRLMAVTASGEGEGGVGEKRCLAAARHFGNAEALLAASPEELEMVPMGGGWVERTLGMVAATSLAQYLRTPEAEALLEKLRSLGVSLEEKNAGDGTSTRLAQGGLFGAEDAAAADTPLRGKTFVLTGTLPTLTRSEASELIRRAGGVVKDSVGHGLDYLVAGEKAGSKLAKAQKTPGVTIIDQAELQRLCGADGQ